MLHLSRLSRTAARAAALAARSAQAAPRVRALAAGRRTGSHAALATASASRAQVEPEGYRHGTSQQQAGQASGAVAIGRACGYEAAKGYSNIQGSSSKMSFGVFIVRQLQVRACKTKRLPRVALLRDRTPGTDRALFALQTAVGSSDFLSRRDEVAKLLEDALMYDLFTVEERATVVEGIVSLFGVSSQFQHALTRNKASPTAGESAAAAAVPSVQSEQAQMQQPQQTQQAHTQLQRAIDCESGKGGLVHPAHPYVVFDLETTGFSSSSDHIIEVAASDPATGQEFQRLINPGPKHVNLTPQIVEITGITREKLELEGVELRQALSEMERFVEQAAAAHGGGAAPVMLAHNSKLFDMRFLRESFDACNIPRPEWLFCDTLHVARDTVARRRGASGKAPSEKANLQTLMLHYGITASQEHRAMSDVRMLSQVLVCLMDDYHLSADQLLEIGQHDWGDMPPQMGAMAMAPAPALVRTPRAAKAAPQPALEGRRCIHTPLEEFKSELNLPEKWGSTKWIYKAFSGMGIDTLYDLLSVTPRDYKKLEVWPHAGADVVINGRVVDFTMARLRQKPMAIGNFKIAVNASDDRPAENVIVTIFSNPHVLAKLDRQFPREALVSIRAKQTDSPYSPTTTYDNVGEYGAFGVGDQIETVYKDRKPLKMKDISAAMDEALKVLERLPDEAEVVPAERGHMTMKEAFSRLHRPKSLNDVDNARARIKLDSLLSLFLVRENKRREAIAARGLDPSQDLASGTVVGPSPLLQTAREALPYEPTPCQRSAVEDVLDDLQSGSARHRLVQGDVGSGKTLVAYLALVAAAGAGYQGALMAPTSLLAQQLFDNFASLLAHIPEADRPRVEMLRGETIQAERKRILDELREGEIDILLGTTALVRGVDVEFKHLAVAVIDEQQKFGVRERARLLNKNYPPPHMIHMTATPIPRSLAMAQHGEVGMSLLKSTPPGRKPVQTELRLLDANDSVRAKAYAEVAAVARAGRKVFAIFPLIGEGAFDNSDPDSESSIVEVRSAERTYEELTAPGGALSGEGVRAALLHGNLTPEEQQRVMDDFKNGDTNVLMATTMIEVGVHVEAASHMVIESPERFGLSQLHQLRGRIGRSTEQSHCVLLARQDITDGAMERLKLLTETTDGFKLAEYDLRVRGPGHLLSDMQTGFSSRNKLPPLLDRVDWQEENELVSEARKLACELLDSGGPDGEGLHWAVKNYLEDMRHLEDDVD